MSLRRFACVLTLLLGHVLVSSSQSNFYFNSLLDEEKLDQSINSILVSDDGIIYFSGFNNFYQYDGYTLKSILGDITSDYGLIDNLILVDSVIYACSKAGLLVYDPRVQRLDFLKWSLDGKEIDHRFNSMSIALHEEDMYISSDDVFGRKKAFIYRINTKNKKGEVFSEISNDGGYLALDTLNNKLYNGHEILEVIDLESRARDTVVFSSAAYAAYDTDILDIEIIGNHIYLGVEYQGLTVLDRNELAVDTIIDVSTSRHGYQNIVSSITPYNDSVLLLTTYENDLIAFQIHRRTISTVCNDAEFCIPKIYLYDVHLKDDAIFVAAHKHLIHGQKKTFHSDSYLKSNDILDNSSSIYDVEMLPNGATMLATFKAGGLYVFDKDGYETFNIKKDDSGYELNPIQIEPLGAGVYIINNTYKLYLFDATTNSLSLLQDYKTIADSLTGYPTFNEIFTKNATAWVTGSRFLFKYDHTNKEKEWYDLSDRVQYCNSPYASADGLVYINTDSSLMAYDVKTDSLTDLLTQPQFQEIKQKKAFLYYLNDHEIFIHNKQGNYGGLVNLKNETFDSYFENLNVGRSYYGINTEQEVYINTEEGLLKINPYTKKMTIYDENDGLYGLSENATMSIRFNYDGNRIRFGLDTTVISFKPESLSEKTATEKLFIQSLEVHNTDIPEFANLRSTSSITLDHDQNFFTVFFQIVDYKNNDLNQLFFKLEGFEEKYRLADERRLASYTNVPPGEYTFHVHATNELGINVGEKQLTVTLKPPWYRTWWFRILAASTLLLLFFATLKTYINYQKRNLEIEKRFLQLETMALKSQMNPHFLFNSLNSIRYLFMKDQREKGLIYITKFAKLLRSTLHHGEEALVMLKEEIDLTELYVDLEKLRFDNELLFERSYPLTTTWQEVPIPPFVIQPLVENAFWHGLSQSQSTQKQLGIQITEVDSTVEIVVNDNGIGFGNSKGGTDSVLNKKKSYGLSVIQERFKLLNIDSPYTYQFTIQPRSDAQGTVAKITISKKNG